MAIMRLVSAPAWVVTTPFVPNVESRLPGALWLTTYAGNTGRSKMNTAI